MLGIAEIIRDVELDSGEIEVILIECESTSVVRDANMPSFRKHLKNFLVYIVNLLELTLAHFEVAKGELQLDLVKDEEALAE